MENFELDSLIPNSIIEKLSLEIFDMELGLTPYAVENRSPKVKILINDYLLFDGLLEDQKIFRYSTNFKSGTSIDIHIEYYGKTKHDTKVDSLGEIIASQGVDISSFMINNTDIIKTGIIHELGKYHLNLDEEKLKYFVEQGFDIAPSGNLYMRDNGAWKIDIESPALQYFSKKKFQAEILVTEQQQITHEKLLDMYLTFLRIRELEKQLKI